MLKDFWSILKEINQKYFADFFIVLLLALILFTWLQSSYTLPEPDSFYHAKMATFIKNGQLMQQFPWLQETTLKKSFVDHHFLYHLLLVPFIKIFNPLVGVKIATVIFAGLAVLLIYWLFKKFEIKWPFLFIIALLASQPWLFRASLVKAPVITLSFLILAFYFVTHQKYKSLTIVSFLSVWLYAGWPLLPAIVITYVLLVWFLEKIRLEDSLWLKIKNIVKEKRKIVPWPAIWYCLGGVAAGIIINPYFPKNLGFYWEQVIKIALVNYQNVIGVGGEWYPYYFLNLISDASLVCALLVVSLLIFLLTFKKQSVYSWTWMVLAVVFFILTLKSRRHVEFFIPFTVFFTAFVFSDYFKRYSFEKLKKIFNQPVQKAFSVIFLILLLSFVFQIPNDLLRAKKDIKNSWPLTRYQKVSEWLAKNTSPGSIIFNTDWDDFPFLFYWNNRNYYLTGLDPTFMYKKDKERYQKYVEITLGKIQLNLEKIIKDEFKADFVFLDNQHKALEKNLRYNSNFNLVYQDEEGMIYRVNE